MERKLAALTAITVLGLGILASFVVFKPSQAEAREAIVYKNPACGCCKGWATYLQRNGYKVTVIDREDMDGMKDELGVPASLRSCHTAKIDTVVVEGHVPLEAIERFMAERPKAKGLASPGMPSGSPGMDGPKTANTVYTFGASGLKQLGTY